MKANKSTVAQILIQRKCKVPPRRSTQVHRRSTLLQQTTIQINRSVCRRGEDGLLVRNHQHQSFIECMLSKMKVNKVNTFQRLKMIWFWSHGGHRTAGKVANKSRSKQRANCTRWLSAQRMYDDLIMCSRRKCTRRWRQSWRTSSSSYC